MFTVVWGGGAQVMFLFLSIYLSWPVDKKELGPELIEIMFCTWNRPTSKERGRSNSSINDQNIKLLSLVTFHFEHPILNLK